MLGGFKLTKFVSCVPYLLDEHDNGFKTIDHEKPKVIGSSEDEASSHVLGLKRDHKKDTLVVSLGTKYVDNKKVTQRLVLSVVSKVFHPIGLVAPFTVTARLLLKDIWRLSGQNWDKVLPDDMIHGVYIYPN